MYERAVWRPPAYAWVLLGLLALLLTWKLLPEKLEGHWRLVTPVLIGVGVLALRRLWNMLPAYAMCGAIALSVFSGAWSKIGLGNIPLNRLLALLVVSQCLLRAPGTVHMPRLRVRNVHLLMALTILYAVGTAAAAGTLTTERGFLSLWDSFGVMPYLLFLVAPSVFAGRRERQMLLVTLLGLGAYLGLTAIFEIIGPHALVFPRYIVSSDAEAPGVLRAGGPFQSSVAEGCATFVCAVAAVVALSQWLGRRRRLLAAAAGTLSIVGCFLSLERGVWLAAGLAALVTALASRTGRRWLVPGALVAVVVLGGLLVVSPALSEKASSRASDQRSVWDRENQLAAGFRMANAKPLFGFGWNRYTQDSREYFRQASDYPLTGYVPGTRLGVPEIPQPLHSTYLSYVVELGLIGACLWLGSLLWAIGEGLFAPRPAEMHRWKLGLLAVAVFVLAVISVNPHEPPFAFLIVFLWAGVALAGEPALGAMRIGLPAAGPQLDPQGAASP